MNGRSVEAGPDNGDEMAADEVAPIQAVEREGPGASAAKRQRPCGGLQVRPARQNRASNEP
jgi:hypothetical protein